MKSLGEVKMEFRGADALRSDWQKVCGRKFFQELERDPKVKLQMSTNIKVEEMHSEKIEDETGTYVLIWGNVYV